MHNSCQKNKKLSYHVTTSSVSFLPPPAISWIFIPVSTMHRSPSYFGLLHFTCFLLHNLRVIYVSLWFKKKYSCCQQQSRKRELLIIDETCRSIHRKSNGSGRRWSSRSDGIQAGHLSYPGKKEKRLRKTLAEKWVRIVIVSIDSDYKLVRTWNNRIGSLRYSTLNLIRVSHRLSPLIHCTNL